MHINSALLTETDVRESWEGRGRRLLSKPEAALSGLLVNFSLVAFAPLQLPFSPRGMY